MKTIQTTIFMLICVICGFVQMGCQNQPSSGIQVVDTYESSIILIRFQKDDYQNYVMVEPKSNAQDNSTYFVMRNNGVIPQEYFIGNSPYIPLPDGWYAIDWRWGDFVYKPSNVLISIPWSNVISRSQRWDGSTTIISSNPLKQWSGVRKSNIDKYLGVTPTPVDTIGIMGDTNVSPDYLRPWWASMYQTLDAVPDTLRDGFTKEDYFRDIARQDSLQDIFIGRLRRVIENGDLEKILSFNYE